MSPVGRQGQEVAPSNHAGPCVSSALLGYPDESLCHIDINCHRPGDREIEGCFQSVLQVISSLTHIAHGFLERPVSLQEVHPISPAQKSIDSWSGHYPCEVE